MKLAFITYEFWPTTPGGAGVLVYHAVKQALVDGHEVHIIIDVDIDTFKNLENDVARFENANRLHCHHVSSLYLNELPTRNHFCSEIFFRSNRFAEVTKLLHREHVYSYLEFFDYNGPAYYTLTRRIFEPKLYPEKITIRAHNTIEIISEYTGYGVHPSSFFNYLAERQSCYLADAIIAPTVGFFEAEYRERYGIDSSRMVLGSPYCATLPKIENLDKNNGKDVIVFYGRLSTLKGLDKFLTAAEILLRQDFRDLEFHVIGPTEHVVGNVNEQLLRMQNLFGSKIKVVGQISRNDLPNVLIGARCAVFANRSESFCYAAHELFQLGIPLVINDIPGFRGAFKDNENALFFDGTSRGLASKLSDLLNDDAMQLRLSHRTATDLIRYAGSSYSDIIPKVRSYQENVSKTVTHLTVVIISERPILSEMWQHVSIPPGVSVDFAVLSPVSDNQRDILIFSKSLRLESLSTIPSVFTILPSSNIILTRNLESINLTSIVQMINSSSSPFAVFGEAVYGDVAGPSAATSPDLADYSYAESGEHTWFALANARVETLFDLQETFGTTTFARPFGVKQYENNKIPIITSPGRLLFPENSNVPLESVTIEPGSVGSQLNKWQTYSTEHPESITVANLRTGEHIECWVIGVTSSNGRLTYNERPVFVNGECEILDSVDIAGKLKSAVYLKSGSITFQKPKKSSIQLLMHQFSGEVALIKEGKISWINLRNSPPRVCEISVSSKIEINKLSITANTLWPEDRSSKNRRYQSSTRVAVSAVRALENAEFITLNFSEDHNEYKNALYLSDLLSLPHGEFLSEIGYLLKKIREMNIATYYCIIPGRSLGMLPIILDQFARNSEVNPISLIRIVVDDFPFLSAEIQEFRDLELATRALAKEIRFNCKVETGSQRLGNYFKWRGITAHIQEPAWPVFGRKHAPKEASKKLIGVFGSRGVVRTCAHMLAAVSMANIACQIEIWNASPDDLDLQLILPRATISLRNGEPDLEAISKYDVILSVYPEQNSGFLLRQAARAGVPFITGPCNDSIFAAHDLRSLAICSMWEDSVDLATQLSLVLEHQRFRSAYELAHSMNVSNKKTI